MQDLAQELVLLREPHALVAQVVDHAVVDADDLVDLGLAHRQEPGRELLVADQPQALGGQPELAVHLARQPQTHEERHGEHRFDADQPEPVVEEEVDGQRREDQVDRDEVGDGAPAEGHTVISYFSKRRYSAARLRPSDSATLLTLPP